MTDEPEPGPDASRRPHETDPDDPSFERLLAYL